jgi:hypothetical protein
LNISLPESRSYWVGVHWNTLSWMRGDLFARGLAIGAITISLATLGWSVLVFRLSGPRVKLTLLLGALGRGGIVSIRKLEAFNFGLLRSQGFDEALLGVEVSNVGRMPTDVTDFGAKFTRGFGFSLPGYPANPSLPHRMEPHSQARWYIPLAHILATAAAVSREGVGSVEVWMEVQFPGRTVTTKERFDAIRLLRLTSTP